MGLLWQWAEGEVMAGWAAFTKYSRRKLYNILLHMHALAWELCTSDGWGELGLRPSLTACMRGVVHTRLRLPCSNAASTSPPL